MIQMYPQISPFTSYPAVYQIYVGDLPISAVRETLNAYFSQYGPIFDIKLGTNKSLRKYAFISYMTPESVERALQNAANAVIDNTPVRVDTIKNMKQVSTEANLFFQNVPSSLNIEQLRQFFARFGKVLSVKLVANNGYGYVQFESKDAADKCLASDCLVEGVMLHISHFIPRSNRENIKNNLYVKNFPENADVDGISEKIEHVFGQFGQVNSKLVALDKRTQKPYAFVCFADNQAAEKAKDELQGRSLYALEDESAPEEEKMVITWVLGKREKQELSKKANNSNNNIYTKNLKPTVTEQQLNAEFSKFGEILSVRVPQTTKPTVSAYICFKNSEDARDAIAKSGLDRKILDLYGDGGIYITYHQTKEQRREYLKVVTKSHVKRVEKPEAGLNLGFQGQPINYPPAMNYNMQFMMPPTMYPQTQQPPFQASMGYPGGGFPMGNPNMMGGHQNKAYNVNMGANMPRKNMMEQGPRKFQGQQQPSFQQGGQMGGGFNQQQQRPNQQQPYRQKRGVSYQKNNYGNRPPNQQRNMMPSQPQQQENSYPTAVTRQQQEAPLTRNNLNSLMQQQPAAQSPGTVHPILKESIESFMLRDHDYQRNLLGTLLYPLVQKKVEKNEYAPKITGMLIDFDNFNVTDILEFIENEQALLAVIQEAQSVITGSKEEGETE